MSSPGTGAGGAGSPGGPGGPVDPRAAERLKRRLRIISNLKKIKHKFIIASGKGGVGKSTVAAHLACALAARGHKVGLLDMDLTGPNIPTMLGLRGMSIQEQEGGLVPVEAGPNLRVISMQFLLPDPDAAIVWRGPIKMQIIAQFLGDVQWGELDYLIVDLPPGSSDEPLSVAQNIADADGVVLVTTPQEIAVGDVRKSVGFARKLELPVLGVIENMAGLAVHGTGPAGTKLTLDSGLGAVEVEVDDDGRFTAVLDLFTPNGGRAMAEAMQVPFLGSVPFDLRVNRAADAGKGGLLDDAGEATKAAFHDIVAKLTAGH
jgi:ATP-binding protein involved in chromosome partitioning